MWPYIFGNTFTFCTDIPFAVHFNCAEKKSYIYLKNINTWQLCGFFFFYLSLKYISYFRIIFMVFISTVAATSILPLYLPVLPARNDLICNPCPPRHGRGGGGGVSRIWVVLLHHCIHTYKIICFINT